MPVMVDALTEPTLPDLFAPNTETLAEPVGPESTGSVVAQADVLTAAAGVGSVQGKAAESDAAPEESPAGSTPADGEKPDHPELETAVTTPEAESTESSAVDEPNASPLLAAGGAALPRAVAEARQEEVPQVAPPAGGAPRVELPTPVRTFRPTQLENLESLVEPPKSRRAGGIVAAIAALGVVAAVLVVALRSATKDNSPVGLEPAQTTHEAAAPEEGKPVAEQTQPAPPEASPGASADQGEVAGGAKLPNAFATAIKAAETDEKSGPAGSPREAKDEPSTSPAGRPASMAEPEQREDASGSVAGARRSGVTKVTIRAVPNDADIFNHRGRRVGVGTAEVEVAPRAKYTYTVLRRFYKPGKITVTDRAPEIVVELQKAPAR